MKGQERKKEKEKIESQRTAHTLVSFLEERTGLCACMCVCLGLGACLLFSSSDLERDRGMF